MYSCVLDGCGTEGEGLEVQEGGVGRLHHVSEGGDRRKMVTEAAALVLDDSCKVALLQRLELGADDGDGRRPVGDLNRQYTDCDCVALRWSGEDQPRMFVGQDQYGEQKKSGDERGWQDALSHEAASFQGLNFVHCTRRQAGFQTRLPEPFPMFTIEGDIVTPDGVLAGGVVVVDDAGRIAEVGPQCASPPRAGDLDAAGLWVLPGFLDMHVHGGGGADFMRGTADAARLAARTHARFGTTGLLATTITASREDTDRAIRAIREVIEAGRGPDEARILGIHLEGPYICRARRGAQPEAFIRPPDPDEFARWVALSGDHVRQITLAPEMAGAEALIRAARAQNIVVSAGHTDATAAQIETAIGWGISQGTHTFNAMPPLHHRKPGAAGAILAHPEIAAELIADGVHLHPLVARLLLAAKGPTGAVLITDAIEGAAMPDGEYGLGGTPIIVRDGTAAFADGTLAGSVLTMNRAFHNVVRFADLPPQIASGYASANAARQLGLSDRFGTLEPGKEADLVALAPETGEVAWTLISGRLAYRR